MTKTSKRSTGRYPTTRVYDADVPFILDPGGLRARLESRPAPTPPADTRLAGVLLPVVLGDEPTIVLTRRTQHLSRHAGEISFPGGLRHDEDADLRATALRETQEELGLPPEAVEVLGALAPVHTFVSAILIVPFVGTLSQRPEFSPNDAEIADVLEFGLADLAAVERPVEFGREGRVYRGYVYEMPGATIWGATGMILRDLLDRVSVVAGSGRGASGTARRSGGRGAGEDVAIGTRSRERERR